MNKGKIQIMLAASAVALTSTVITSVALGLAVAEGLKSPKFKLAVKDLKCKGHRHAKTMYKEFGRKLNLR